ncbi:PTPLA-domain-containing protein [Acrodontium crateriforme]|uniref:Very-long-chain (3R)-3-hydroxyacyl-CoA dehydratase n=1 Tax=Acrodontium crateriforme TaxID=150365 RepID=A0AAQ3R8G6_9PEZI|nr:PTPLA-domain-containing protein [Acrodontium crateriforme]
MAKQTKSGKPVPEANANGEVIRTAPPSYRSLYLILYNFVSAVLWSVVLGRVLLIAPIHGYWNTYAGVGQFTKWTQTLAGMEVLHALTGVVRAPIFTTVMQVASRYLLVWGIVNNFPNTTSHSLAYTTMLIAWGMSEIIRYSYFATNLAYGRVPGWLQWLRYNAFFVLYPLGISSECWLVWISRVPAASWWMGWEWVLRAILFVYVPGSYILYTHMMAQRRKVMRGSSNPKKSQ